MRLHWLFEVRPQEKVLRRTVEQIVDSLLVVPLLHTFAPQMVEHLVDVLSPFEFQVPEQVIEVPKIFLEDFPMRTSAREPQLAEQPRRGGRRLQGLLPEQDPRALTVEQIVDIPVPVEGLEGFRPRVQLHPLFLTRVVEVFTDQFPLLHPRTHLVQWMRLLHGSSNFFQIQKSARLGPSSGSELGADFSPWTPAAYGDFTALEEDESEPRRRIQ